MSDAPSTVKFVIAFAVAYAVLYVLSVQYNLALFTYHAATEEFHLLVQPTNDGSAMYWYGWLATSALAALAIAGLVSWLPVVSAKRLWHGCAWTVPLVDMVVFVFMLRRYFVR